MSLKINKLKNYINNWQESKKNITELYWKYKADGKNSVDSGNKQEIRTEKDTSNFNKK